MKAPIYNPSYFDLDRACAVIANRLLRSGVNPDRIVGLTRGGLIPAVVLSHILETPMVPVSYSSLRGKGEYRAHENQLPEIEGRLILLVDDICDSGHTLREVHDYYERKNYEVVSAALYYKRGAVYEPTHYWQTIPADAPWVTFPWEV